MQISSFETSLNFMSVILGGDYWSASPRATYFKTILTRKYISTMLLCVVGTKGDTGSVLRSRTRSCLDLDEPESSNRSERAVASWCGSARLCCIRLGTRRTLCSTHELENRELLTAGRVSMTERDGYRTIMKDEQCGYVKYYKNERNV